MVMVLEFLGIGIMLNCGRSDINGNICFRQIPLYTLEDGGILLTCLVCFYELSTVFLFSMLSPIWMYK